MGFGRYLTLAKTGNMDRANVAFFGKLGIALALIVHSA
jgi:hypothetical protein